MKIFLFTILLLFRCCGIAQTQPTADTNVGILVGQCMTGMEMLAQLRYEVNNQDTLYTLMIRDSRRKGHEEFCSVRFSGGKKTVNELYTLIKQLIFKRNKKRKDYTTTVALSGKLVVLSTSLVLGSTSVIISLPQGSNSLTEWQVDKVFGKI